MSESNYNDKGEKRRVRIKVRSRKSDREKKKITRLKVVSILLAAAIVGVVLGLLLGRLLNKALLIHRPQPPVSLAASSPPGSGAVPLAPSGAEISGEVSEKPGSSSSPPGS